MLGFAFANVVNIFIRTILCNCLLPAMLHVLQVINLSTGFQKTNKKKNSWDVRSLDIRGQLSMLYSSQSELQVKNL